MQQRKMKERECAGEEFARRWKAWRADQAGLGMKDLNLILKGDVQWPCRSAGRSATAHVDREGSGVRKCWHLALARLTRAGLQLALASFRMLW